MYDATQEITHGFIYQDGQYRTLDTPFGQQTDVTGINDRGELVGFTWDDPSNGPFSAFSHDRDGFKQIPRFSYDFVIVYPRTVNNLGMQGGWLTGLFPYNTIAGYVTIYGYPYVVYGNGVFGMNDKGQIVGNTFDTRLWRTVGYVATLPK